MTGVTAVTVEPSMDERVGALKPASAAAVDAWLGESGVWTVISTLMDAAVIRRPMSPGPMPGRRSARLFLSACCLAGVNESSVSASVTTRLTE